MKLPLDVFLKKHWTELQGRQREYWDGIMKGIGEKLNGTVGKNETKGLRKTFTNCQSSKHEVPPTVKILEERWQSGCNKRKSSTGATYLQPPKNRLNLSPHTPKSTSKDIDTNPDLGLSAYKTKNWRDVSLSMQSD